MTNKVVASKPLLILLYGFPGAGKSHFARNFVDQLVCAHVHNDRIRHELFEEPQFDQQEDGIVNHLMDYMSGEFLNAGVSIIYDADMSRRSQRKKIYEKLAKKNVQPLVVWFQLDPETAFQRTSKRDKRKADDKYSQTLNKTEFNEIAGKLQHPTEKENYVVVSGKHTFQSQKQVVMQKLINMGVINQKEAKSNVAMPGMINIIPRQIKGRVDMARRNINIR